MYDQDRDAHFYYNKASCSLGVAFKAAAIWEEGERGRGGAGLHRLGLLACGCIPVSLSEGNPEASIQAGASGEARVSARASPSRYQDPRGHIAREVTAASDA